MRVLILPACLLAATVLSAAELSVIALIGERGREVLEFIEDALGHEGMKRSVVVCATSERPAPLRVRACLVALAVADGWLGWRRTRGLEAEVQAPGTWSLGRKEVLQVVLRWRGSGTSCAEFHLRTDRQRGHLP